MIGSHCYAFVLHACALTGVFVRLCGKLKLLSLARAALVEAATVLVLVLAIVVPPRRSLW